MPIRLMSGRVLQDSFGIEGRKSLCDETIGMI